MKLKANTKKLVAKEVLRCKNDFYYFCKKYLRIVDKNNTVVPLNLNAAQIEINEALDQNNFVKILKGRQFGSTTYIAARFFWEALFNENIRVAVVAHSAKAVGSIFSIYQFYYDNLPPFLKLKRVKSSANEMAFETGSFIRIGTANSQNFRGSTYKLIHASEAAFWESMTTTISSLFQTASNNPTIIVETTPNGLNEFYTFWRDNNGYEPLFLSWKDHLEYRLKKLGNGQKLTGIEKDFTTKHELTKEQRNWFVTTLRTKLANNITAFQTEYPTSEEEAFIATGAFVFPQLVTGNLEKPSKLGWQVHRPPAKYRTYVIGVDTASGSPNGDYSAIAVIDVTNKNKPLICATFYDHLTMKRFGEVLKRALTKWEGMVVIERNSYGLTIIDDLRNSGYPFLYRETKFDKFANKFVDKIGFYTSAQTRPVLIARLIDYINSNRLECSDERLRYEIMNFIYKPSGKAEAEKGFQDDMIFATGLALMGIDQSFLVEEEIQMNRKPTNVRELVEWEATHGTKSSAMPPTFWDQTPSVADLYSDLDGK